ncbi:MAG: NTPase [Candidatus Bathyarchaeia archaeon]
MKKLIFLTGHPGVGKTTALRRAINLLTERGLRVGGMVSSEIREGGRRVGFEVIDISTSRRGILAQVYKGVGPRFGRYTVNIADLVAVGVNAIKRAVNTADIIVVDEVGPMELLSPEFREAVKKAVDSGKVVVGTLHHNARGDLIDWIRSNLASKIIEVTLANREGLPRAIVDMVLDA